MSRFGLCDAHHGLRYLLANIGATTLRVTSARICDDNERARVASLLDGPIEHARVVRTRSASVRGLFFGSCT
jgi:hypothetical protein